LVPQQEAGLAEAEGALKISEHFNPEPFLVPGDGLFGVGEGGSQEPDRVSPAADDDVEGDGALAAVEDVGEQDGGSINGIEGAEGEGAASVVDQGIRAEADDEGEAVLLEPADEFGLAEAGVGEEEGSDMTGEEAGDESTEVSYNLRLMSKSGAWLPGRR